MKSTDKKIKTVAEAVNEVVEGKKQNIELQVYDYVVDEFDVAPIGFKTIYKHEDIAGYSVNSDFVAIMTKDGATFIYMVRTFNRIHHYSV